MYSKKCKWCENIINVEKQNYYALHIANCDSNPNKQFRNKKTSDLFRGKEKVKRINLKLTCPKCEKEFQTTVTESMFKRDDYKKFCSRKCANGRIWSEEHKQKLSHICKTSEKVKNANKEFRNRKYINGKDKLIREFICQHCGEIGNNLYYRKNQRYHKECWMKISGGIRNGSSRGKSGWYKGFWCDSSYELAFVIYNLEHNVHIERNKKYYLYNWKNEVYKYYPDFRVNGILTEIKNYRSELTNAKLRSVDEKIMIYYKDTIKPFLDYAIRKYGKNFISLYEKRNMLGSSSG